MEKQEKKPVNYPFRTKAEIVLQAKEDIVFMLQCLVVLYDRQTTFEQDKKTTQDRNARGFMSSHAVNGTNLAKKVVNSECLTMDEVDKARSIVVRYGKQLADHFRQERVSSDPTLSEIAKVFGV